MVIYKEGSRGARVSIVEAGECWRDQHSTKQQKFYVMASSSCSFVDFVSHSEVRTVTCEPPHAQGGVAERGGGGRA